MSTYLDKPDPPIARVHHEGFVRVWLVVFVHSPVDRVKPLRIFFLDHGGVIHFGGLRNR